MSGRAEKQIFESCLSISELLSPNDDELPQLDILLPPLLDLLGAAEALVMRPIGAQEDTEIVLLKFFLAVRLKNRTRAEDIFATLKKDHPEDSFNVDQLRSLLENWPA